MDLSIQYQDMGLMMSINIVIQTPYTLSQYTVAHSNLQWKLNLLSSDYQVTLLESLEKYGDIYTVICTLGIHQPNPPHVLPT